MKFVIFGGLYENGTMKIKIKSKELICEFDGDKIVAQYPIDVQYDIEINDKTVLKMDGEPMIRINNNDMIMKTPIKNFNVLTIISAVEYDEW